MGTAAVRILLATGDSSAAFRLGQALEFAGFEVNVVTRGADAVRACQLSAPDVLVCHTDLPDVTAIQLARRIRRQGAPFPVIVIADEPSDPNGTTPDRLPAAQLTMPIIPAPCDEQRLIELIRQLVGDPRFAVPGFSGFPTRVIWPTARRHVAASAR